jgi:hypothetical protein
MIRLVGYLVADSSMQQAASQPNGWFTIYEAPPNLNASQALERCAARMRTWENRLRNGTYNGVTMVALEAHDFTNEGLAEYGPPRVLLVRAREIKTT